VLEIKRQLVYTLGSFFAFNPKPATFGLRSLKPVAVVEKQADTYTTLLVGIDPWAALLGCSAPMAGLCRSSATMRVR